MLINLYGQLDDSLLFTWLLLACIFSVKGVFKHVQISTNLSPCPPVRLSVTIVDNQALFFNDFHREFDVRRCERKKSEDCLTGMRRKMKRKYVGEMRRMNRHLMSLPERWQVIKKNHPIKNGALCTIWSAVLPS